MRSSVTGGLAVFFVAALSIATVNVGAQGGSSMRQRRQAPPQEPQQAQQAEAADDRRDARVQDMTGWTKLGEKWVDGTLDRDTIVVGVVEGTFRRVMLKVEHSRVDLLETTLHFGDGSIFVPETRMSFAPGSTTRVIDLPGAARVIRRATFRYANLPGGGRAQVELWAR